MLATDPSVAELSAADATVMYRHRWRIEYLFRWVRCLMGCRYWIAESQRGATLQLYLALIGAVLLPLDLGHRPTKRIGDLMPWHRSDIQASLSINQPRSKTPAEHSWLEACAPRMTK